MVVHPRLALFAALLTPAVFLFGRPWITLLVIALVVALVWLIDWLLTISPQHIDVARRVPASITLDRSGTIRWEVTNNGDRAAPIRFSEALAPSLMANTRRADLRLEGGRSASIETDLHPTRRGRFGLGEIVVRVDGPLGFAARQDARWEPEELKVLPRFPSRAEAELKLKKSRLDIGVRSARMRGGGSEFEQLRDFTPDDEFRRVDWAATARANRMIVRTYRAERNQTVINVLDNGRLMASQVADYPRVEHAMDAIMALTTVATGLGDRTGLLVFDGDVRSTVKASAQSTQLNRITNAMFDLDPVFAESDYHGAFSETLLRFSRRTMLVIHTELVEQTMREFLLPSLKLLTRSHIVVIAAVRDPEVDKWATEVPTNAEDAHRSAAAQASLAERERTIRELQRRGATVIDAIPGKLSTRLMDLYLDIKATGRL